MQGENFVVLVGKIVRPSYREVGNFNTGMFKASLAIPAPNDSTQYVKVAAWSTIADALNGLPSGTYIKVHGHIEESSYDGKCRHCKGPEKKYWTEVIIDNFIVVEGE